MAEPVTKPTNRDIQMYTAGTLPLPPHYPEVGVLDPTGKTIVGDKLLSVEDRVSSVQLNRYLVRRADVSAILVTAEGKLDPKTDVWLLGAAARDTELTPTADGSIYGIVFVRESVGVVMQVDRAMAAGEIMDMADPCEDNKENGCEEC